MMHAYVAIGGGTRGSEGGSVTDDGEGGSVTDDGDDTITGTFRAWIHFPKPDRKIMAWAGCEVWERDDGSRYMVLDNDVAAAMRRASERP